ncbi:type IV pilin [Haloarcula salina]|uniref:type IV pilin n=1 Tax=Haloarcula salina TaxID=1429914 RepID=UPI001F5091E3|nr:type IV pilin N-terminal domain-containing protein [Haloarcula salina]
MTPSRRTVRLARDRRGVTPVVGVALMVSITVLLAAVVGGYAMSAAADAGRPIPTVARSTGSFETGPSGGCGDNTILVRHEGGERIAPEDIEVAVRLPDADAEARLVDLPVSGTALGPSAVSDPDNIVYDYCVGGVIADGGRPWTAGRAIAFQVNAGGGTVAPGDRIEVSVVHEPSGGILAAVTITARPE